MNIKLGDTVKYIGGTYNDEYITPGAIGIVKEIGKITVRCLWNKSPQSGQSLWYAKFEDIVLVEPQKSTGGVKNDKGKPSITLIPKDAIWGTAAALTFGADKYGRHNFRAGIAFSRLADAAQRHLTAYMEGENNDPESGLSHLDHAMASLAMLKFMDVNRKEQDDRYVLEKKEISELKNHVVFNKSEIPEKYDQADDALYLMAKNIQEKGR